MRNRFPTHALSRQPWGRDMASRELRMHACQHNVIALSSRWQRALGQNLRTRTLVTQRRARPSRVAHACESSRLQDRRGIKLVYQLDAGHGCESVLPIGASVR